MIEIGHPAHVHLFKHLCWELEKKGWKVLFITQDKDCAISLLKYYRLPYLIFGVNQKEIYKKIISLPKLTLKMIKIAQNFKPDIFFSRVSPYSGYTSFLLKKPHITLTDTENVRLLDLISEPFATVVLTSDSYYRNHGSKQIRFPGYKELAYLHPNVFTPDERVLEMLEVKKGEKYAIVRFVAWNAHHDIGHKGISYENKIKLVNTLSRHLRVFISSETELPDELKKYKINIPPEQMHNALAFAHLFIGESSTMASESAVLGTPSFYINDSQLGYTNDLAKYELLYTYTESEQDQIKAIKEAEDLACKLNVKEDYLTKREKMLSDKIDVSAFLVWFVENYPESVKEVKAKDFDFGRFK